MLDQSVIMGKGVESTEQGGCTSTQSGRQHVEQNIHCEPTNLYGV